MRIKLADKILAISIAIGCYLLLGQLEDVPTEGKLFPSAVLWIIIIGCVGLFIRSLIAKGEEDKELIVWEAGSLSLWLVVVVIFVLYVAGIFHVGFFSCTLINSALVPTLLSRKDWKKSIPQNLLFAVSLTTVFYLFFDVLMNVRFPEALLI